MRAGRTSVVLRSRQTSQAATDMSVYSTVQTGPKTAFGGVQNARSACSYQPFTFWMVESAPRAATPNEMARKATSARTERVEPARVESVRVTGGEDMSRRYDSPTQVPSITRSSSVPDQWPHDARRERAAAGDAFLGVGQLHRGHSGVRAEEPQRFDLPRRGTVVHPGQPGQLGVGAGEQIGESAAGQVRRAETVAHVPAGTRDPSRGVG